MEHVIYAKGGGMGLILQPHENIEDFVVHKTFKVGNDNLVPGIKTTLGGMFTEPIEYVGAFDDNYMVFHTGDSHDLFGATKYYYVFLYLTPTRIANCYTYGSARDFNWRDNKWK